MGFMYYNAPQICTICNKEITFADEAVAVTDDDGKNLHWDCWKNRMDQRSSLSEAKAT